MNFDDPKLTAYVLGELESTEDRAAVEALLREHPELSAELEETRAVAEFLRRELKAEDGEALTTAQRNEVLAAATLSDRAGEVTATPTGSTDHAVTAFPWWRRRWVPSAVAATVILTTSIVTLWNMQQPRFIPVSAKAEANHPEEKPQLLAAAKRNAPATAPAVESVTPSVAPPPAAQPESIGKTVQPLFTDAKDSKDIPRDYLSAGRSEPVLRVAPNSAEAKAPLAELSQKQEGNVVRGFTNAEPEAKSKRDKSAVSPALKLDSLSTAATAAATGDISGINPVAAPALTTGAAKREINEVTAQQWANPSLPPPLTAVGTTALSLVPSETPARAVPAKPAPAGAKDSNAAVLGRNMSYARGRGIEDPYPQRPELERLIEVQRNSEAALGQITAYRFQSEPSNTESYDNVTDNPFLTVRDYPLSTFSIDVDTASYSNVRRFLTSNQRPPKGAVRIEELINYFPYTYPQPQGEDPFSCTMEVASCPWTPQNRLVRVGLKGREIAKEKLPPSNLVFLLDVSGSMQPANKLPLVKECMQQLAAELREQDTVGIVVYAGSSGTVLEPTSDKAAIRSALDRLEAGGSTNGASGIQGAYDLAQRAFKKEGNNHVILCTDGDFNVGVTNQSELVDLIQRRAKSGVFLSVLGFGMGNTKDSTLEKLADKGNGNYAYIDSLKEGRKVLVEQMAGTLFTIAKDVKIQVEFNPAKVGAYRLIGYENRLLAKEDFNDDTKDAGEIGAGHTVTALYEVVPAGAPFPTTSTVDPLKYQQAPSQPQSAQKSEIENRKSEIATDLLTLKLRFKQPDGDKSVLREFPLTDSGNTWEKSSTDFRWAAAVASFGMVLRDSPHRGNATWESVTELANEGKGADTGGYRTEFIQLIDRARQLVPVTPLTPTIKPTKGEEAAPHGKAASLIVPEFDLNDTPLIEAVDALVKKSRELDPEKKGVSIVFAGGNNEGQPKVSLRMRNTTVLDIAKAIASVVGFTIQEQGEILILKAAQP